MSKRSIFSNYIFNASYSLLSIIIPIITIPYVSRILLANGVGQISLAQNAVSYFVMVASLGIPNYGIREIAKEATNIEERSKIFWEIFSINLISTLIATTAYYFIIGTVPFFSARRNLYAVVGIALVLNAFNIDWFYKGIEEFKYITIRSYIVKIVSLVSIFLFVKTESDIILYALISTATTSANYILNILHVRNYVKAPNWQDLKLHRHLKSIFFMFATAIAVELYSQLDTTMIGAICGETQVGYYTNSMKLTKILVIVITAIGTVLLPRLSIFYAQNRLTELSRLVSKAVEYILFISLPCSAGLLLISDDVVNVLFGSDFGPAITTMRVLVLLVPIVSIGNIFGSQLMITLNMEKTLTITVMVGAIINITLNSFLIPSFQQNGAAVASVAAELGVMTAQIMLTRNCVKTGIRKAIVARILLQCMVMLLSILVIRYFMETGIVRLALEVLIGGVVFLCVGILNGNSLMTEITRKVRTSLAR